MRRNRWLIVVAIIATTTALAASASAFTLINDSTIWTKATGGFEATIICEAVPGEHIGAAVYVNGTRIYAIDVCNSAFVLKTAEETAVRKNTGLTKAALQKKVAKKATIGSIGMADDTRKNCKAHTDSAATLYTTALEPGDAHQNKDIAGAKTMRLRATLAIVVQLDADTGTTPLGGENIDLDRTDVPDTGPADGKNIRIADGMSPTNTLMHHVEPAMHRDPGKTNTRHTGLTDPAPPNPAGACNTEKAICLWSDQAANPTAIIRGPAFNTLSTIILTGASTVLHGAHRTAGPGSLSAAA